MKMQRKFDFCLFWFLRKTTRSWHAGFTMWPLCIPELVLHGTVLIANFSVLKNEAIIMGTGRKHPKFNQCEHCSAVFEQEAVLCVYLLQPILNHYHLPRIHLMTSETCAHFLCPLLSLSVCQVLASKLFCPLTSQIRGFDFNHFIVLNCDLSISDSLHELHELKQRQRVTLEVPWIGSLIN